MGVLAMKRVASILGALAILAALTISTAYPADFLSGARGGGMGFSYFILADDPAGALYNPSALGYMKGWQTQFNYEKLNSYDYQIVQEKPYFGQFGVSYCYPKWGTFAINSLQSGSFSKLTNIPTQNHVALSYGRQLSPLWSVGGSMKILSEWGFGKRSAFDMDLSVSMRTNTGLAGALALENITRATLSPEYLGVRDHLPRRSRLGLGYFIVNNNYQGALLLAGQVEESGSSQKLTTSQFNFGTEWWFMQNSPFSFAIRSGYAVGQGSRNDIKTDYGSPALGLSLNQKISAYDIRLDYSWQAYPYKTDDGSLPANHYVALTFGWGGVPTYPARIKGTSQAIRPATTREKPATKYVETAQAPQPAKKVEPAPEKPASQVAGTPEVSQARKKVESTQQQPAPQVAKTPAVPQQPNKVELTQEQPASKKVETPQTVQPVQKVESAPGKPVPQKVETPQSVQAPKKIESTPEKPPVQLAQAPQVIEAPQSVEPSGQKPEQNRNANLETPEITPINIQMEVNEISSLDLKRVVFYVRPQQVIKSTTWKLFIFKAKVKDWNEDEAGRLALRVIEGRGVPPINVMWDGVDSRGNLVSKGKYYYILTATGVKGEYYLTDWFDFKLK
jgi:hypothetical protein